MHISLRHASLNVEPVLAVTVLPNYKRLKPNVDET